MGSKRQRDHWNVPDEWVCRCGTKNYPYRYTCENCRELKGLPSLSVPKGTDWYGGPDERSKHSDKRNQHFSRDPCSWLCVCVTRNFSRENCVFCGRSRDSISSAEQYKRENFPQFQKLDWVCACGTNNHPYRRNCVKCELPKGAPDAQPEATGWCCVKCNTLNHSSGFNCMLCGYSKHNASSLQQYNAAESTEWQQPPRFHGGDWLCKCKTMNHPYRSTCTTCSQRKKVPQGHQMDRTSFHEDYWACECGAFNHPIRSTCMTCRLPKYHP